MRVTTASEKDSIDWDGFVSAHAQCVNYHRWAWKRVIEQAFGWRTFYLMAQENEQVRGVLPLIWLKSPLFGSLLCSVPFFSEGGIVAENQETREQLLVEAVALAGKLGVQYLELRHAAALGLDLRSKTDKVTLVCDVDRDPEKIMQSLTTKMRTNVRRSLKSELKAEFGGAEFLDDFYEIFAVKMRDLGTPVYGKKFFERILANFPNDSYVCRITHGGKTVSAAFLTGYRGNIEANWSASASDALGLRPNVFLFWNLLCFAGSQGYKTFDFGRSSAGSGTYNFKLQWNTRVIQLHWDYWTPSGQEVPELNPRNPRYRTAISIWRKLPLSVTKLVGPRLSRCLP